MVVVSEEVHVSLVVYVTHVMHVIRRDAADARVVMSGGSVPLTDRDGIITCSSRVGQSSVDHTLVT